MMPGMPGRATEFKLKFVLPGKMLSSTARQTDSLSLLLGAEQQGL